MKCYLMDLQSTIKTGRTHYWKQNCSELTTDLKDAGLFEVRKAIELKMDYFHGQVVLVEEETGKNETKGTKTFES